MQRPLVIAVAYWVAWLALYALTISFYDPGFSVTPWYLPSALTFFLLLTCGLRYAAIVPIASLLRYFIIHPAGPAESATVALLWGCIPMVAYGGAAAVLLYGFRVDVSRRRLVDIAIVVPLGGAAGALLAAWPAVAYRSHFGGSGADTWTLLARFWTGDANGLVTLTPLLLMLFAKRVSAYAHPGAPESHEDEITGAVPSSPPGAFEIGMMILAFFALLIAAATRPGFAPDSTHFFYSAMILLVWVTIRCGLFGATVANVAINTGAVLLMKPLNRPIDAVAELQQFTLALSVTALSMGCFVSAYARSNRRLRSVIAEQQETEAHIRYVAYHDDLTGLANRAMLELETTRAIERARRNKTAIAALYVDLNDFKLVNDTLGHAAGDIVLRQLAQRLGRAARSVDSNYRIGGDEFALVLPDLPLIPEGEAALNAIANAVAERIHTSLREPFVIEGTECYVTASVGVSFYPVDAADEASLIAHADAAMYRAKQLGHAQTMFYTDGMAETGSRFALNASMYRAVERNEFSLVYQPIFDIAKAWEQREVPDFTPATYIRGAEALVRWNSPEGTQVSPGEFLPMLEATGLIEPVGAFVMEAACTLAAELERDFGSIFMGVNISLRQLYAAESIAKLIDIIKRCGHDPQRLVLEITEAAAMHDPALTSRALTDFARLGARVAIDDFGTGTSSFTRLHEMPVTTLKIDYSFVRHLPHDSKACNIVGATIDLARSLQLTLVAEGIENDEQWKFLVERGCRFGQGFRFARPLAQAEFRKLVEARGWVTSH